MINIAVVKPPRTTTSWIDPFGSIGHHLSCGKPGKALAAARDDALRRSWYVKHLNIIQPFREADPETAISFCHGHFLFGFRLTLNVLPRGNQLRLPNPRAPTAGLLPRGNLVIYRPKSTADVGPQKFRIKALYHCNHVYILACCHMATPSFFPLPCSPKCVRHPTRSRSKRRSDASHSGCEPRAMLPVDQARRPSSCVSLRYRFRRSS